MSMGPEARELTVAGRSLRCHVCDYTRFWEREAQLSTAAASFFGFDWASTKAACMVCERCGFVHWFLPPRGSRVTPDTDLREELEALRQTLEASDGGEAVEETVSS